MHPKYTRQQFVRVCDCGCGEPTTIRHRGGAVNAFIRGHNGRVRPPQPRVPNHARIAGDIAYIGISQGQTAIIDAANLPLVAHLRWIAVWSEGTQSYYVRGKDGKRAVWLHRLIMDAPPGKVVDHRDHDGLNNRRENLRVVTQGQNNQNHLGPNRNSTTGARGVTYGRGRRFYRGQVYLPDGRLKAKQFPLTTEGLTAADAWCRAQRAILMPFSDQD